MFSEHMGLLAKGEPLPDGASKPLLEGFIAALTKEVAPHQAAISTIYEFVERRYAADLKALNAPRPKVKHVEKP